MRFSRSVLKCTAGERLWWGKRARAGKGAGYRHLSSRMFQEDKTVCWNVLELSLARFSIIRLPLAYSFC